MKLAATRVDAQALLSNDKPAWRNHSVSNSSAAAPERKKTAHVTAAIGSRYC